MNAHLSIDTELKWFNVFLFTVQQASLSCDTDVALSNMKNIADIVKDDHQNIVSHVCKQVSSFHYVCVIRALHS